MWKGHRGGLHGGQASGKQRPAAKVTRKKGSVSPLSLQLTRRTIGALQLMDS